MTLTGLAARNLMRNKVRTGLTVLGVAMAVVTFLLIRTAVAAWTAGADYAAKDRLVTRHKVTFVMTLPKRYVDQVGQAEGVKSATWANWFGGKDPANDKEFFASIAIDQKTYFDVVPEVQVSDADLAAFREDKSGAIVGDVLAKKLGWKVGQKVTLISGIYPTPDGEEGWTFNIVGLYTSTAKNVDRSTFFFRWDRLNEALPEGRKDQVGWIMARVNDPARTADIGVAIDKVFEEQDIQTLSQDEHSFATSFLAGFSAVLVALDMVAIVIIVIMMLVLGNTIAMGVRERTSEFATMRAIGFLPKHILFFILSEAAVLGALGGVVGLAIAYPFLGGMGRWIEENMGGFFPTFQIPTHWAAISLVLTLGLGVLAAAIPARGAARLRVTDGLRRVA